MFQCRTTNHVRHITMFQNRCYFQRRLPYGLRSIAPDFNWASNELVDM